ncbi:MAG: PIN domain-containing protein [Kiritimatiellae bacterium]|nr:PIN domain-containing protein [Kiritimatiellia bacterium]
MSRKAFWDTNLLIYHIEQMPGWQKEMTALVEWQKDEGLEVVTSAFSLAEILVRPLSVGKHNVARRYRELIGQIGALPFGVEEATRFAQIRAQYPDVKPPDALQLACASVHGVDFFLTSERRLKWLTIENVGTMNTLRDWYDARMGERK